MRALSQAHSISGHMMRIFVFILAVLALPFAAFAQPSDELFEKLKNAPNEQAATLPEADVVAALLESGSGTTDLLMERANTAAQNGDYQLARELYDRIVILSPDFTEGWFQRSALFVRDENYAEALRDLGEVLALEPRHFPAWFRTANLLETLGSKSEAVDAYKKALEIHPNFMLAKRGVARLSPKSLGQSL